MAGESDELDKLFESVADGESIDWDALERAASDEETRALLRKLRLIADVSEVHRSQVDDIPTPDSVVTTPATVQGRGWLAPQAPPALVAAVPAPDEGAAWGPLLLVRKIGEGSYGEVYQAHDTWLDHPVALKLLRREAETRVQPSDLLHEARKLARVRHTNVVTVHGADRHNGRVGFWMDFVDGETLSARVARGRMSAGEATSVGQEVCRALAAVHRANIIHRDVKAQNVMRAHDGGRIILMDFGAGQFVDDPSFGKRAQGTPLYLAPEVLQGGDASVRSDIYAAGVLLFYLVSGRFPVEGATPRELFDAHMRGQRRRLRDERPDLSDSFITIVERAIDPDPARRYSSAGEMEAKLAGEPISRPEPVPPRPPPPPLSSSLVKRVAIGIGGAFLLTGVLGFIAARFFEVTLRVDRAFGLGAADIFAVGASALLPFIVMWLAGAAVVAALVAIGVLFRTSVAVPAERLIAAVNKWDPVATAAGIVIASAAWWLTVNLILFADFLRPIWDLAGDIGTPTDLTILASASRSIHRNHYFVSAYSVMLLALIVWRWFPHLEKRCGKSSTIWGWKLAALAVGFAFLAAATLPRRLVWERYPVVEFDNRSAVVIGTAPNELLVFTPDEPGRPRRRVRSDSPDLQRTGEARFLFDPAPAK
jgi:serine/threonine-protein kinase